MNEFENQEITPNTQQKRRAIWAAIIFTLLGLAFFLLSAYIVFVVQDGRFDLSDKVLMPVAGLMFLASLVGYFLIRKDRVNLGTATILGVSLVPPIIAALFLQDFAPVSIIFILLLATLLIFQVLPVKFRRLAIGVTIAAIITTIAIEIWNPAFRISSSIVPNFAAIVVPLAALGLLAYAFRQAMQGNLRIKLTIIFVLGAVTPLLVVGAIIGYQTYNNQLAQILLLESQVAKRVAEQVESFILERESELRILTDVRGLGSLPLDEQTALLSSLLSAQNLYDELILVDRIGQEQIYISRLEIVTPDDLGNRRGADEFERPKATGETYFGPVTFDEQTGEPRMVITIPIFDLRTGNISYTLIANFRFKTVWDLMAQADVAGSGVVYMINSDNQVIAHKNPSVVLQGTQVELPQKDAFTLGIDGTDVAMARTPIALNEQTFYVIAEQLQSEALDAAINSLIIIGVIIGLTLLGAAIFGAFMARLIATPIRRLATAAQAVSEGDLSQEIEITTRDEIGDLSSAFNNMTDQLRGLIGSLETQVTSRTRALETSSEVSRRLSTILDQDTLVREVVEQLTAAFNFYHAHIYLFDEGKQNLMMVGGTGDAGRSMLAGGHKIQPGRGLVGRAAANNEIVLIPDVSQAEGWLPNPLLPDTKAEVAVPIAIGDEVLGVLDVQQNITDGLSEQDATLIQSIANQVAIAIQNAQAFTKSQRQAIREAQITAINQRIQSATSIDDVLQVAISELGQVLNAERADIELSMAAQQNGDSTTRK